MSTNKAPVGNFEGRTSRESGIDYCLEKVEGSDRNQTASPTSARTGQAGPVCDVEQKEINTNPKGAFMIPRMLAALILLCLKGERGRRQLL